MFQVREQHTAHLSSDSFVFSMERCLPHIPHIRDYRLHLVLGVFRSLVEEIRTKQESHG